MKRSAKKRVVTPRAAIVQVETARVPIEPGSLFDLDQTGSPESFAADKVSDAIAEPLHDVSGEHHVAQSLGSDQRSADEDEKQRFSDPSRVIEAAKLRGDAFTQDDSTADNRLGPVSGDDSDSNDDSSNGAT